MRRSVHHIDKDKRQQAQELRRKAPLHERIFWKQLSQDAENAKLRFRRQQPIAPYIADFACMQAKLLIELDGASHDASVSYDEPRDNYLREQGFTIMRFSNEEIGKNLKGIVETVIIRARELIAAEPPTSKN